MGTISNSSAGTSAIKMPLSSTTSINLVFLISPTIDQLCSTGSQISSNSYVTDKDKSNNFCGITTNLSSPLYMD